MCWTRRGRSDPKLRYLRSNGRKRDDTSRNWHPNNSLARNSVDVMSTFPRNGRVRKNALLLAFVVLSSIGLYRHQWDSVFDRVNRRRVVSSLVSQPAVTRADTNLLFVFRPQDCPYSKSIVETLDSLHHDGVTVTAVLVSDSLTTPSWRELVSSSGVDFPATLLRPEMAAVIARSVNDGHTPLITMLDVRHRRFREVSVGLGRRMRQLEAAR